MAPPTNRPRPRAKRMRRRDGTRGKGVPNPVFGTSANFSRALHKNQTGFPESSFPSIPKPDAEAQGGSTGVLPRVERSPGEEGGGEKVVKDSKERYVKRAADGERNHTSSPGGWRKHQSGLASRGCRFNEWIDPQPGCRNSSC